MKKNYYIVGLIFLTYAVISFLTNILGPLIPDIIDGFGLSLTLAAFLPFSFFIAYGVMSIPSGVLVELYGEKPVMTAGFLFAFVGAAAFAALSNYEAAILSLFIIGIGMAMLQVAINPLLREAGGEAQFAFNSVLGQLIFGLASFLSPQVYSHLVTSLKNGAAEQDIVVSTLAQIVPVNLPWISLYWVLALVSLAMVLIIGFSRLPNVALKDDERPGGWAMHKTLFSNKTVILYFWAIFAYVGTEQGVANWISKHLSLYHGLDPQIDGANVVSYFWGMITAGCLAGLVFLKLFDSRRVLIFFTGGAIICLTAALFGPKTVALLCFPAVGLFISVMWSIIFSLALNSLDKHHGSFSGILCTAIVGGAVVPLAIGWLGDLAGLRFGMLFLYVTLGYIFSIGFWAKPLIKNRTIF